MQRETGLEKLAGMLETRLRNTYPFIYKTGVWSEAVSLDEDVVVVSLAYGAGELFSFNMTKDAGERLFHRLGDVLKLTHGAGEATPDNALEASELLVRYAEKSDDGCSAISTSERGLQSVVLVATPANPERLALLRSLHQEWYPQDDG